MKILHTSDWHLGKRLEGRDRLEEQLEILLEIGRIASREKCRIVLVAGDVFDVSTPPAEAERLFYQALKILSEENRLVIVVSGNHDDPVRVSCAACMLESRNVLICPPEGFPERISVPDFKIVRHTARTLLIEEGGELVNISCLSYPSAFGEDSADKSYTDNLKQMLETDISEGRRILVSHLFAAGATVSGEERCVEVGGIRVADASLFEPYDYVALGHIHKFQKVKHGCYCGSISQYAFDEKQEKGVSIYDTLANGFEFRPLESGRRLVRLSANAVDAGTELLAGNPDCYCELTLKLDRPLTFSENKLLKNFDNLVSLRIELDEKRAEEKRYRELKPEQLFSAYWAGKYGKAPAPEVVAEFLSLFEGEEDGGIAGLSAEAAAAQDGGDE